VVAEKILSKEGNLEKRTLAFTQILKQIKDGLIDVKVLEEIREAELANREDGKGIKKLRKS